MGLHGMFSQVDGSKFKLAYLFMNWMSSYFNLISVKQNQDIEANVS